MANSKRLKTSSRLQLTGVYTAAVDSTEPFSIPPQQEFKLMLLCVRSGSGILKNDSNTQYTVTEQSLFLLPLWQSWVLTASSSLSFCLITFRHPDPERLISSLAANGKTLHNISGQTKLNSLITQILRLPVPLDQDRNNQKLKQLLYELKHGTDHPLPESTDIPPYIQAMKELIDTHYGEDLTLDNIAAQLGKSKFHLSRAFHTWYHSTPVTYLTSVRLEKAADFLQNTSLSVKDVSHRVGFSNDTYFISLFKKHYGLPPRQYRLAKRAQSANP